LPLNLRHLTVIAVLGAFVLPAPGISREVPARSGVGKSGLAGRVNRALGRFVFAPDSSFFLYEWSRPFEWSPSSTGLPPAVSSRTQTFLYKVDMAASRASSELLLQPAAGGTYYLGDLSPNGSRVGIYEVDRDTNAIRAGSVKMLGSVGHVTWYASAPNASVLDRPAFWISDVEQAYQTVGSSAWVVANADDGTVRDCPSCGSMNREAGAENENKNKRSSTPAGLPPDAKFAGESADGNLSAYIVDSDEWLKLYVSKDREVQMLFETRKR
jgi:hypothetical protein